jgi:aryl-alcohol dehydrogenase-like predicted oxidoreductase
LRLLSGAAAAAFLGPPGRASGERPPDAGVLRTRAIPSSGEELPVVGIGTWQTFDVGASPAERRPLEEVLKLFGQRGGRVVDSSPMYGRSEEVLGEVAQELGLTDSLFLATKVWTTGRQAGIEQMEQSLRRLRTSRIDLEQVHNLVDAETHLETLSAWKEAGRIRYVGITHYSSTAYREVERFLRSKKLDFLQINYSLVEPEAGERLIPLAAERGVAVIANRPFGGGEGLRRALRRPLPPWAQEVGCRSWAQFFLKWILADTAVTCVIPGTGKVRHLEDNLAAALGPLPDAAQRRRMAAFVAAP